MNAISNPATKLPIVRCDANPITIPTTAEEASKLPATVLTCGITSNAESTPIVTTVVAMLRLRTR